MTETIELANSTQSAAIADLINKAYRPNANLRGWTHESDLIAGARTSAEQIKLEICPSSPILVAVRNHEIIACVQITHDATDCWIGMLATLPTVQNSGLGKKMLSAAESFASSHFAPRRLMIAVLSSRDELLSFYQRRGYQLTGKTSGYPIEAGVGTPLVNDLQVLELSKEPLEV